MASDDSDAMFYIENGYSSEAPWWVDDYYYDDYYDDYYDYDDYYYEDEAYDSYGWY